MLFKILSFHKCQNWHDWEEGTDISGNSGDDGSEDNVDDCDEDEDNRTADVDQGLVDNNPSKSSSSLEL